MRAPQKAAPAPAPARSNEWRNYCLDVMVFSASCPGTGSLLAEERVIRLASYRQLQALSNVLENVGVVDGLDYFFLPSEYNLRPPTASELRVVVQGRAYLAERDAMMGEVPVLPASALASAQGHPLLVLSLDQGSIGAAGVGFAESLGMMIHAKWDKFHRLMRDINGALSGACGGAFLKARIFSAHLWAVNHKPFGTGLFSTAKVWMLNTFMALASAQSNVFRKYAPAIAHDFGMCLDSEEDYIDLFDAVPFMAKSFTRTMDVAKMGRWFSWNSCGHQQLQEFWVAKMIYEFDLAGEVQDPDEAEVGFADLEAAAQKKTPREELAALKAANGGIKHTSIRTSIRTSIYTPIYIPTSMYISMSMYTSMPMYTPTSMHIILRCRCICGSTCTCGCTLMSRYMSVCPLIYMLFFQNAGGRDHDMSTPTRGTHGAYV